MARGAPSDAIEGTPAGLGSPPTPRPESTAWGEEIADSMESASEMIAGLAAGFSIPQDRITLEIRMDDVAQSTRH